MPRGRPPKYPLGNQAPAPYAAANGTEPVAPPAEKMPLPGQMLALKLEMGDNALDSPLFWERLAELIIRSWSALSYKQSPLATIQMLTRCGEHKLKLRLADAKMPASANTDLLQEYEALMHEVFRDPTAHLAPAAGAEEDDEDDE